MSIGRGEQPKVALLEMAEPLTYTVPEAATLLGISNWSAYEAIKRGELPARKIGRRIVVPRIQLEQWLNTVSGATRQVSQ